MRKWPCYTSCTLHPCILYIKIPPHLHPCTLYPLHIACMEGYILGLEPGRWCDGGRQPALGLYFVQGTQHSFCGLSIHFNYPLPPEFILCNVFQYSKLYYRLPGQGTGQHRSSLDMVCTKLYGTAQCAELHSNAQAEESIWSTEALILLSPCGQ